jgi:hypothetical protein
MRRSMTSPRARRALGPALSALLAAAGPRPAPAGVVVPDPRGRPDPALQAALDPIAAELGITRLARQGRASLMLVDLTAAEPVHAGIAADTTLGAASVAKLGILAAAYLAAADGELELTPDLRRVLEGMIRRSSNPDATRAIEVLGLEGIAAALEDPRLGLHDPRGGGLWVGRDFTGGAVWRVEPRAREAHAASAASVARFYALLARDRLVNARASAAMREILAVTTWDHKFVAGLRRAAGAPAPPAGRPVVIPGFTVLRKSGSYGRWQGDSALVEAAGRRYVLACLLADRDGGEARLRRLAARVDRLLAGRHAAGPGTAPASPGAARR